MDLNQIIVNAIQVSQRCQRNWDLTSDIDDTIISTLKEVIKNSPTKQNEEYYSVEFITDRAIIEKIYQTTTYDDNSDSDETKNPQTLANLVLVFFSETPNTYRNPKHEYENQNLMAENTNTSIGIVSGQLSLAAAILGLRSGFCACFNRSQVSEILGKKDPKLILGIGYPDLTKDRLEHHKINVLAKSFNKPLKIFCNQQVEEFSGSKPNIKIEYFPPLTESLDESMSFFNQNEDSLIPVIVDLSQELSLSLSEGGTTANTENHSIVFSLHADDVSKLEKLKSKFVEHNITKEFHNTLKLKDWNIRF